jgi:hypothetical protein
MPVDGDGLGQLLQSFIEGISIQIDKMREDVFLAVGTKFV